MAVAKTAPGRRGYGAAQNQNQIHMAEQRRTHNFAVAWCACSWGWLTGWPAALVRTRPSAPASPRAPDPQRPNLSAQGGREPKREQDPRVRTSGFPQECHVILGHPVPVGPELTRLAAPWAWGRARAAGSGSLPGGEGAWGSGRLQAKQRATARCSMPHAAGLLPPFPAASCASLRPPSLGLGI